MTQAGGAPAAAQIGWDVVVVGAGPAGLLAAGRAAMLGARVLLLEKMEKPARKLRITGKGRANVTNLKPLEAHLQEIHPEPRFLRQAFGSFFNHDLIALLAAEGVTTRVERGDRVFPESGLAWDVADALVAWAKGQGVEIVPHARVAELALQDGALAGFLVLRRNAKVPELIRARCGILATGGQSYPGTGSTGDGYRFAETTGHRVVTPRPSLVRLETQPAFQKAQGLVLKNVQLTLWLEGKKQGGEFGEAEFTAKGLAGAAVLRLSRRIVEARAADRKVELTLDLKPALDAARLDARLLRDLAAHGAGSCRDLAAHGAGSCRDLLRALLPVQLIEMFCQRLGLDPAAPSAQLDATRRKRLLALLKELRFEVTGHGGWEEAIVTAGGVSVRDLDPRTMASRKVGNLYFAGELIDLDANTGGYNLQIAFSTGWLAGESAARQALGPGPDAPA